MATILDGKEVSKIYRERLKKEIDQLREKGYRKPSLAVILVGNDPASQVYVNNKRKACSKVGIESLFYHLPEDCKEEKLLSLVKELNENPEVDGILVQLPLPKHINPQRVIETIRPDKDVDGFHPENMGKLIANLDSGFIPCTPLGIKILLEHYGIDVQGKDTTIVGAGYIVGKPLSVLLLNQNATVTTCHIYTKDLKKHTLNADILISATGVAHLIKEDMVKEGAVVIDVGISKKDGKIVGDVDFEKVKEKASYITPVPGGVGPMTVTALLLNTFKAYKNHLGLD
ncbi:MAG: bifunctional methylenetetrahydrofolate dehydrogenase/methenyltetrahydrofolate cyclohydrolase FolD [Aquificae bacterium]|jgi:methylenetetrahydrofolate dehydrogenase (NADP+)/methenyltetrahydrofolate cyclohydrolase|nr:bifunctional methylenetetrahydrofolate dehydrogenase/methenyltetrahydrofolate cyclohydrolase FolD [Aquificota bacterium]